MIESIRKVKVAALPAVPAPALFSAVAIGSFAWLLLHDRVHPLVVYCLQLYLSF
jgi:hypothetical protein